MQRPVTVFFAGFACGLVFLAALLWWTGKLRNMNASAAAATPQVAQAQPAQRPAPAPAQSHEPPPVEGSNAAGPASAGSADAALMQRRLIIPVEGVQAKDLRDGFNEMRGGHRHEALDIMAPRGTPVLAADEGNVAKLFLSKPGGLTVYQFDGSQTYCYYYAHLDHYAPGLKEGTLLRKGEVLGYVGSSGDASAGAPHLHFTIFKLGPDRHWWQGTAIDPYEFLGGLPGK